MGFLRVLLLCLLVIRVMVLVGVTGGGAHRPPAMYVFGSSILDVGNNNYLPGAAVGRANRRFNGIDFPASIPTGRFSNGYNIADYVAKNMGFACSPPAYLSLAPNSSGPLVQTALSSGINYASGGAGILDSTKREVHFTPLTLSLSLKDPPEIQNRTACTLQVSIPVKNPPYDSSKWFTRWFSLTWRQRVCGPHVSAKGGRNAGNTIPLSKQVQYFNATRTKMVAAVGPHAATTLLSKSVFLIGIGNNDMFVSAFAEQARNRSAAEQKKDAAALYADLISNYTATMTELHAMGARKFALVGVGLQGCVPGVRALSPAGACWDGLNDLSAGFDAALRTELAGGLSALLPGAAYSLGDCLGFTRDVLADPRASGFDDAAGACCGGGRLSAEAECFPNSTLCADRDRHVFWDRAHFSQRMASLIARAFYDGPAKYTTPISFMQLAQSS
ncbi:unnamed protein product [Urochloa decumbens]|uniref:GDSL esterase/lipase n=1 Tax=Urochloa decumbens TaxID=240449 RepID=A0ABC9E088_9POAL